MSAIQSPTRVFKYMPLLWLSCILMTVFPPQLTADTFSVTNTNNSGAGSLRQALIDANTITGPHLIEFSGLTAPDPYIITVTTDLPALVQEIEIDGTTAPGFVDAPVVYLSSDGALVGLQIDPTGAGSTIRGLAIYGFDTYGINLNLTDAATIQQCYIGLQGDGTTVLPNGNGIYGFNVTNCLIGAADPANGNVVSGNLNHGIWLENDGPGDGFNTIDGNIIGLSADQTNALGNNGNGIRIYQSNQNDIGSAGSGNIIAGNGDSGIYLDTAESNTILANIIGTNEVFDGALGNGNNASFGDNNGITLIFYADMNTIGGSNTGAGNVITSSNGHGIYISDNSSSNYVYGNYIGTDVTETVNLGNTGSGIYLYSYSNNNTIGGSFSGLQNTIVNNSDDGITIDFESSGTIIEGNTIGSSTIGGNGDYGIEFATTNGGNTWVGGASADQGNLIENNDAAGIGGTGFFALGPTYIQNNQITANGGDGIEVGSSMDQFQILYNEISNNGDLGIDLDADGVTGNDGAPDSDFGGNTLQNYPALLGAAVTASTINITGSLESEYSTTYTIEFFANSVADGSGYGEGEIPLGTATVTTDGTGYVYIDETLNTSVDFGIYPYITATATNTSTHNTSEFSEAISVCYNSLTVTNGGDSGSGTLREALGLVCDSGYIHVDPTVTTINLTSIGDASIGNSALSINNEVTIYGNGVTIQRDAAALDDFRLFLVNNTGNLTLSDATLQNGLANVAAPPDGENGGAIYALDNVTLNNVTLRSNTANNSGGAIYQYEADSYAYPDFFDCTFENNTANSGNGGALAVLADITVSGGVSFYLTNTQMTLNSAVRGGAIYLESRGTTGNISGFITGVTIDNNTAATSGGGVHYEGFDTGAITLTVQQSAITRNTSGTEGGGGFHGGIGSGTPTLNLNVSNSTLSSNTTTGGGGAILNEGSVDLSHVTIALNTADSNSDDGATDDGGGVLNTGPGFSSTTLTHTIIASNVDNSGTTINPDVSGFSTTFTSNGYNLIGDNTGAIDFTVGLPNGNNDYVGDSTTPIDPQLGALQNNGGSTETHALETGSLAIDNGNPAILGPPTYDQRGMGYPRIQDAGGGAVIDIGAYEVGSCPAEITVTDGGNSGANTLRQALLDVCDGGTITIDAASVASVDLDLPQLTVDKNVTITTSDGTIIPIRNTSANDFRIFFVDDLDFGTDLLVVFENLEITGGTATDMDGGGGIFNNENLTLLNCIISGNTAESTDPLSMGGGIANRNALKLDGCTIQNNVATNTVASQGGGIYSSSAFDLTILNSTFYNNTASGGTGDAQGGGIYAASNYVIQNSTISTNTAETTGTGLSQGGGFYSDGSQDATDIRHCTFTLNVANEGGGIHSNGSSAVLTHTIVADNEDHTAQPQDLFGDFDTTSDYNFIGDNTGSTGFTDGVNNNQVGTAPTVLDPLLEGIADNGGPTLSHMPRNSSPVVEAGNPTFLPSLYTPPLFHDQTGIFDRVRDADNDGQAIIDIGSIERDVCPTTWTVTDGGDSGANTLRDAIENICPDGTITIDTGAAPIITLTSSELLINKNVTITTTSAEATIERDPAAPDFRIFNISGSSTQVNLENLVITNGQESTDGQGGGIYNEGTLIMTTCTVTNNTVSGGPEPRRGGGIYNIYNLDLIESTVSQNTLQGGSGEGGGIYTENGALELSNSLVNNNNSVGDGGGIYALISNVYLTNSTVSNNNAVDNGGGLYIGGSAGLFTYHATITGNIADNDINGTGTGGGILNEEFSMGVTLYHTIVAGNVDNTTPFYNDIGAAAGGVTSSGYNLIGEDTGLGGFTPQTGDLVGTGGSPIDPLLGGLTDNGGLTQTHALLEGSPAIDAGDPGIASPPATDQRGTGFDRVTDGNYDTTPVIDIGAFEYPAYAYIGDFVWEDTNQNGIQDAGETGLANVTVELRNAFSDNLLTSTTTDGSGFYSFPGLITGLYYIVVLPPTGYYITLQDQGGDDAIDSDVDPATGRSGDLGPQQGDIFDNVDAGLYQDTTAPSTVIQTTPTDCVVPFSMTVDYSDDLSGVSSIDILESIDGGPTTVVHTITLGAPSLFGTETYDFTPSANGTIGVYTQATDDAGNVETLPTSAPVVFLYDNTSPTGTPVTITSGNPSNALTIDVEATVSDNIDLASIEWFVNSNSEQTDPLSGTSANVTFSYDATGGGTYEIYYIVRDACDNSSPATPVTVEIDVDAPTATITATNPTDTQCPAPVNLELTVEANDAAGYSAGYDPGSVVIYYRYNGGAWTLAAPTGTYPTYTIELVDDAGTYEFQALAGADVAGNTETFDPGLVEASYLLDCTGVVSGVFWEDTDGNGIFDGGESPLLGVTIDLYADTNSDGLLDGLDTYLNSSISAVGGLYSFNNLGPGAYLVQVTDTGNILDGYTLTSGTDPHAVTIAAGETYSDADFGYQPQVASIGDFVWNDLNGDGVQDGGEPGLADVTLDLYLDVDGSGTLNAVDTVFDTQITDVNGAYSFDNLPPNDYLVTVTDVNNVLAGFALTGGSDPVAITIISGTELIDTADFGYQQQDALIGDFVWHDMNANGIQDAGALGLSGVTVELFEDGGLSVGSTVTLSDGSYSFLNLPSGAYYVTFTPPADYESSPQDQGGDDLIDSDADPVSGETAVFTLNAGESNPTIDAGFYQTGSVSGFVWRDDNEDGIQDAGEPGFDNVLVELYDDTATLITSTNTLPDGTYTFTNLIPGSYYIRVLQSNLYYISPQDQGGDDTLDSDVDPATGESGVFVVQSGDNLTDIDVGRYLDPNPPTSTITSAPPEDCVSPYNMTVSFSDDKSGVVFLEILEAINGATPNTVTLIPITPASLSGSQTYEYTPSAEGTIELYSRVSDAASNSEALPATAPISFFYDATVPTANAISAVTPNPGTSLTVEVQADVSDNVELASIEWFVDGSPISADPLSGTAATPIFSHTVATGGAYDVSYTVYDQCGLSAASTTLTIEVDNIAPFAEIISVTPIGPACPDPTEVLLEVDASDAAYSAGYDVANLQIYYNYNGSGWAVAPRAGTYPNFTVTLSDGEGSYEFQAVAGLDVAGNEETLDINTAEATFELDCSGPTSEITSSLSTCYTNPGVIPIEANVSDNSVVESVELLALLDGGSPEISLETVLNPVSPVTFNVDFSAFADGVYDLFTRATDQAGNIESIDYGTPEASFQIDSTAPFSAVLNVPSMTNQTVVPVAYANVDDAGSGVASVTLCYATSGGGPFGDCVSLGGGTSGTANVDVVNPGTYYFQLTVVDACGNSFNTMTGPTVVDTVAPTTVLSAASSCVGVTSFNLDYIINDGANSSGIDQLHITYTNDGTALSQTLLNPPLSGTVPITAAAEGTWTITAIATDVVGNVESPGGTMDVVVDLTTPTVTLDPLPTPTTNPLGEITLDYSATDLIGTVPNPDGPSALYIVYDDGFGASFNPGNPTDPGFPLQGHLVATLAAPVGNTYTFSVDDLTGANSGDGTYYFRLVAVDCGDNYATSNQATTTVARISPVATLQTVPDCPPNNTIPLEYNLEPNLISEVEIWSNANTGAGFSGWQLQTTLPGAPDAYIFGNLTDGTYQFAAVAYGTSGLSESSPPATAEVEIQLDSVSPTVSIDLVGGNFPDAIIEIPYTASDNLSGVATVDLYYQWSIDGSEPFSDFALYGSDPSPETPSIFFDSSGANMPGNGFYRFRLDVADGCGNVAQSAVSEEAHIDTENPSSAIDAATIATCYNPLNQTTPISVEVNAQDNGSGIVTQIDLLYRFNNGSLHVYDTDMDPAQVGSDFQSEFLLDLTTLEGDGHYALYSRAHDSAGNTETVSLENPDAEFTLDSMAPVVISGPTVATVTQTTIVSISYQTADATSGVAEVELHYALSADGSFEYYDSRFTASGSFAFDTSQPDLNGDGQYFFQLIVRDACGYQTESTVSESFVDTTTPVATLSLSSRADGCQTSPNVQLTYTIDDGAASSGLTRLEIYVRHNSDWLLANTVLDPPASGTALFTATEEGLWEFQARAYDAAGNVEPLQADPEVSVVYDETAPNAALNSIPSFINNTNGTITLAYSATDLAGTDTNPEGLTALYLLYDDGAGSGFQPGSPLDPNFPLEGAIVTALDPDQTSFTVDVDDLPGSVSGDAAYHFRLVALDCSNNSTQSNVASTTVDREAPLATLAPVDNCQTSVDIPINYNDDLSGITQVEIWRNLDLGSGFTGWMRVEILPGAPDVYVFNTSGDGTYQLAMLAVDAAGNREGTIPTQPEIEFFIDTQNPTLLLGPDAPTYVMDSIVPVEFMAEDLGSGINRVELRYAQTATGTFYLYDSINADSGTFDFDAAQANGDGRYFFRLFIFDQCGNMTISPIGQTFVDTVVPTTELSYLGSGNNCQLTLDVSFEYLINDGPASSGLVSLEIFGDDGTGWQMLHIIQNPDESGIVNLTVPNQGEWHFQAVTTDQAGNVEPIDPDGSVQVTVGDDMAPSFVQCPEPITLTADANCQVLMPDLLAQSEVVDNCDPQPQVTQSLTAGTILTPGEYDVQLVATDQAGNVNDDCGVIVTVIDGTGPQLTLPPDVTIDCTASTEPDQTGWATALDNCDAQPQLTYDDVLEGDCPATLTRTWTAMDASGNISSGQQIITLLEQNDPPEVTDDTIETPEDTPVDIPVLANDSDPNDDLDPNTLAVLDQPEFGTAISQNGVILYEPALNFNGTDTFTYQVADATGQMSDAATVIVTVTPVNDAPIVDGASLTTPEDTTLPLDIAGSDVENDPLSYSITVAPEHGDIVGDWPEVSYQPNENYFGDDSFTFVANDGELDSEPALVSITITPVNDAPVAVDDATTIPEDGSASIAVLDNDDDVDGDDLTIVDVTAAAHGTTVLNPDQTVNYTPNPNFFGEDTFSYTISDGQTRAESEPATVTVTVEAVNDPPQVAGIPDQSVAEGTPFATIELNNFVTDVDNDLSDLTWTTENAVNLQVVVGPGQIATVTPLDENWNGTEIITFIATDPDDASDDQAVSFTVTPVNDPPVVTDIADQSVEEGEAFAPINLNDFGSDVDNDPAELTWTASAAVHYEVVIDAGIATITALDAEWNGSETITFTAEDPDGLSDSDDATFTVTPVNDAPQVQAPIDDMSYPEDSPPQIVADLADVFVDADAGDMLSYTVESDNPGVVVASVIGTELQLTFEPDAFGDAELTVTATDAANESASDVFAVTVTPVNDSPTVVNPIPDTELPEDSPTQTIADLNDVFADVDAGDELTFFVETTEPSPIEAQITDGVLTVTPLPDAYGPVTVVVTAADTENATISDAFMVIVTPVNDAPEVIAAIEDMTFPEDSPTQAVADLWLVFEDPDFEDVLTFIAMSDNPDVVQVDIVSGQLELSFAADSFGTATITVTATDPFDASVDDIFDVEVTPENDPPAVVDPLADVTFDEDSGPHTLADLAVVFADADPGDVLTFSAESANPDVATVELNGTTLVVTLLPNAFGVVQITATATDEADAQASDDFLLTVNAINDPPTAPQPSAPADAAEIADAVVTLQVENAADIEADDLTYHFQLAHDANFSVALVEADGITEGDGLTGWIVPNLSDNQPHFWRARAFDGTDYGDWSTVRSFTTNIPPDAIGDLTAADFPEDQGRKILVTWTLSPDDPFFGASPSASIKNRNASISPELQKSTAVISTEWEKSVAPNLGADDVEAYHIYRSDDGTTPGDLLDTVPAGTAEFVDNTVTNGETYAYTVFAFDGSNLSELVPAQSAVAADNLAPVTFLDMMSHPDPLVRSAAIEFTFVGQDTVGGEIGTDFDNLTFLYRLNGGSWQATSESVAEFYPLEDGSYRFEVAARDEAGNVDTTSVRSGVQHDFTVETRTLDVAGSSWLMLGVPREPSDPTPAAWLGTTEFDLFHWDPLRDRNPYYDRYVTGDNLTIQSGWGYWLWLPTDATLQASGDFVDWQSDFVMPLYPGWNQLGQPFAWDVAWNHVQVRRNGQTVSVAQAATNGWIQNRLYWYDGANYQYGPFPVENPDPLLQLWGGYWLLALEECELLVPPQPYYPGLIDQATASIMSDLTPEWMIRLQLDGAGVSGSPLIVGVHPQAQAGFDVLDTALPPVFGDYATVSTHHADWLAHAQNFTTDFLNDQDPLWQWVLHLDTNARQTPLHLHWDGVADIPPEYGVYLYNEADGSAVDLRQQDSLAVLTTANGLPSDQQTWRLVVNRPGQGTGLPTMAQLAQNYPNPFNPSTTIRYQLATGEDVAVSLKIYNASGQLVRTLVDCTQASGAYEVQWDGRNDRHEAVASGIYFYELTVSGSSTEREKRKMVLLR